jgi:hypothetical protein
VTSADFLEDNFLSEDRRHSVTKVKTNSARALATNAVRGHVWDNFSSESYKDQPAVAQIVTYNPMTGVDNDYTFDLRERGVERAVGYYRTPSLIAIWSSAPFFHNNALGRYTGDPSVAGRLAAFEDAAEKLLWPEKRAGVDSIWRTTHESAIRIPAAELPDLLRRKLDGADLLVEREGATYLELGPIPAGTPVNLLANLDLSLGSLKDAKKALRLVELAVKVKRALIRVNAGGMTPEEAKEYMRRELVGPLVENSNCTDFVVDRGHYFGTELEDEDKRALIEFLKTF